MIKDENSVCSVCLKAIEREDAPVLTMGHFARPRLLCDGCAELIEKALKSHVPGEAEAAIARLGESVGNNPQGDSAVLEAMEDIFRESSERAEKIRRGEYDFSLDEADGFDGFEEIPDELLETEEDKKKTEREEETNRKFNKIMDIVTAVIFVAAALVLILYFIKR